MSHLRDVFLNALCNFTHLHSPATMRPKNALAFKHLLRVADTVGDHLDERWAGTGAGRAVCVRVGRACALLGTLTMAVGHAGRHLRPIASSLACRCVPAQCRGVVWHMQVAAVGRGSTSSIRSGPLSRCPLRPAARGHCGPVPAQPEPRSYHPRLWADMHSVCTPPHPTPPLCPARCAWRAPLQVD